MNVDIPLDDVIKKMVQEAVDAAMKKERLYTVKDLAERYQVSEDTIRREIREGKFGNGVVKIRGEILRVNREGIEHYERSNVYEYKKKTYANPKSSINHVEQIVWKV